MLSRIALYTWLYVTLLATAVTPCCAQLEEFVWARRSASFAWMLGFADNGSTLVASYNGFMRRWNVPTGQLMSTNSEWYPAGGLPYGRSISPDGRLMAWKLKGDSLSIREVASATTLTAVPGHGVSRAIFTSDGRMLVAQNSLGTVVYSVPTLVAVRLLPGVGGGIALSGDDATIARNELDGIAAYSVTTGERRWKTVVDYFRSYNYLSFVDSGRAIAAFNGKSLRLFDAATGDSLAMFEHSITSMYDHIAYVHGGRYAITLSNVYTGDSSMRVWDLTRRQHYRDLQTDSTIFPIRHAITTFDDKAVLVSSGNGVFNRIDITDGNLTQRFPNAVDRWISAFAVSRNGNVTAVSGPSGVTLLTTETGETIRQVPLPQGAELSAMALADDGKLFAVSYTNVPNNGRPGFELWNVAAGARLPHPSIDRTPVALAFLGNGERLIIAQSDGTLGVWPTQPAGPEMMFPRHTGGIRSITVSDDGRTIATADFNSRIRVFDRSGNVLHERAAPSNRLVLQLALAKDLRAIYAATQYGPLLRFSLRDRLDTAALEIFSSPTGVTSVAVTPDDRYIVAGAVEPVAFDQTTLAESRRFVDPLFGDGGKPIAIDGEGRMIVTGFDITMWRLPQVSLAVENRDLPRHGRATVVVDRNNERVEIRLPRDLTTEIDVSVRDALGRAMYPTLTRHSSSQVLSIDTSTLTNGAYYMTANVRGTTFFARFLVAR